MKNKLISMTDYVLLNQRYKEDSDTALFQISNYAQLLKQPLKLGMFVPCDEDGNVLKEPEENDTIYDIEVERDIYECDYNRFDSDVFLYKQAKNRVYFEGFQFYDEGNLGNGVFTFNNDFIECKKKVEKMVKFELILTKSISEILGYEI